MNRLEKFIKLLCDICDDDSHGYDQAKRWGPDYDCSSLLYTCAAKAGYNVPSTWGNTSTMRNHFSIAGWRVIPFTRNMDVYGLRPGSIILAEGNHVEGVVNSSQWAGAHINERGTITGGMTGDQTGKEIGRCKPYHYAAYPMDWDYILEPPEYYDDPDYSGPEEDYEYSVHYILETDAGICPMKSDGEIAELNGAPATFLSIWTDLGSVEAKAYTEKSGWLPELTNPDNITDHNKGAIGDGSPMTGVSLYFNSPDYDHSIFYQVYAGGSWSDWYEWCEDQIVPDAPDEFWAGDLVNPIEKFRAKIGKATY